MQLLTAKPLFIYFSGYDETGLKLRMMGNVVVCPQEGRRRLRVAHSSRIDMTPDRRQTQENLLKI